MPDDDSLFGGITTGTNFDPSGGNMTMYDMGYHENTGNLASGPEGGYQNISDMFTGSSLSPEVAMMLQSGLMDIKYLDDYYMDGDGNRVSKAEMWGRNYGHYFEDYDWREEAKQKEKTFTSKRRKQGQRAKDMTRLTESFGKQGFASSGQQTLTRDNLYDSAVREQNLEDIGLRKNVMKLHTNWENGMWDTFASLAKSGALTDPFKKNAMDPGDDWSYHAMRTTDDANWADYWDGDYADTQPGQGEGNNWNYGSEWDVDIGGG